MEIMLPVIVLGVLGAVFAIWLGIAQKIFFVTKDPRTEHIFSLLPGSNCGACGRAGCFGLAEAMAKGETDTITCPVVADTQRHELARLLGFETDTNLKRVATLICGGGKRAKENYRYEVSKDCNIAAILMGGPKACEYGCIGFGTCAEVCPFNAITMGSDGLPRINPAKCTACMKCINICPKKVLVITTMDKEYHVCCNSNDKGPDVMKACSAGCIACGKCVKACPKGAISLKNNLALIDYSKCDNTGKCMEVCPTGAIIRRRKDNGKEYYRPDR